MSRASAPLAPSRASAPLSDTTNTSTPRKKARQHGPRSSIFSPERPTACGASETAIEANPVSTAPPRTVVKIGIEGNIAAGKSTFLRVLAKELSFYVVQEPVNKWQNVGQDEDKENQPPTAGASEARSSSPTTEKRSGGNLLDMMYKDPHRWSFTFQSYAFLSRMRAQMAPLDIAEMKAYGAPDATDAGRKRARAPADEVLVAPPAKRRRAAINSQNDEASWDGAAAPPAPSPPAVAREFVHQFFERSVYSDRYCFAALGASSGTMSATEHTVYKEWHDFLCTRMPVQLSGLIYLRSDPVVCKQRLGKRGRDEEVDTVGLDYLQSLHEAHEAWLMRKEHKDPVARSIANLPILVIDVNEDFEHNPAVQAKHLKRIHEFLAGIKRTL